MHRQPAYRRSARRTKASTSGKFQRLICAHANLLDPASPDRYQTHQIIKAIKLAHLLGIPQVITTEGEPKTPFGHSLSMAEQIFSIKEKWKDMGSERIPKRGSLFGCGMGNIPFGAGLWILHRSSKS